MKFVRVIEPGLSIGSRVSWKGEVIDGKVKLNKGYSMLHFVDMQDINHYDGRRFPNTAAECREIEEISEEEFNKR